MHSGAAVGGRLVATLAACALLVVACHRPKRYEANVEVTRIAAVRKDDAGRPLTLDVEISYAECPGSQNEVVRGGAEFAACVAKYKVGDKVRIAIDHEWVPEGHYKWTIRQVGECARVADPSDDASYAMVRECDDWVVNGSRVGFQCRYVPEKALVDKCPWFRRR